MSNLTSRNTFKLAGRTVRRGWATAPCNWPGPRVMSSEDHDAALAVLRAAVAAVVNHIDTSDFYGPHVTNQLIREALHTYPDDLVIVSKLGAVRGSDGTWLSALEPADLERGVHDNLSNLGLDAIEIVNIRCMGDIHTPSEGSIEKQVTAMAELRRSAGSSSTSDWAI